MDPGLPIEAQDPADRYEGAIAYLIKSTSASAFTKDCTLLLENLGVPGECFFAIVFFCYGQFVYFF